jgi:hypothetical protein
MFLVSRDNSLDERVTDDIALGKFNYGNAFRVL